MSFLFGVAVAAALFTYVFGFSLTLAAFKAKWLSYFAK